MGLVAFLQPVQAIFQFWNEWKLFFERSISFSQDSVHVIVGVLLMLGAALLLRKPVSNWRPWLVVLVFTCINEFADLWVDQWPTPGIQWGESAKDVLLTMMVPTVLLLSTRFLPRLYAREPSRGRQEGGS